MVRMTACDVNLDPGRQTEGDTSEGSCRVVFPSVGGPVCYALNPRTPADGYDVWSMRTAQTLPDGSKIIVYSNFAGMTMLYVNLDAAGTGEWVRFSRYDNATGNLLWAAEPSAVTGYNEAYFTNRA